MDNFDKIIKQKAEQFEVPYNEAHWAEMDGKLNSIRTAKIRKNIFGSAAIMVVVAISSYFIFSNDKIAVEGDNNIADNKTTEAIVNDVKSIKEKHTLLNNTVIEDNTVGNEISLEETQPEIVTEESNNENKVAENKPSNKVVETENSINKMAINTSNVNAEFIVYNNRACLGEGVNFESQENNQPVSYTWNFGDGTISHKANPTHVYKESLVYTVTLTLLDRQTGVEYTTIQQDVITVLPLPEIVFTYLEESKKYDDNSLKYPYTIFNVKNTNKTSTYKWSFGNGESSTSAKTKTIYKKPGSFVVKLVATNSYGCENSTRKKVTIKNGSTLYTPNAFTPNADGDNDNFIPISLLEWDIQFEMTIIDKSGKLIYKTSDKNEPWNGKMNNTGKVMDVGVYLWQVITYDAEGTPHNHHGNINIVK